MKVYVVTAKYCDETTILAVCLTEARAKLVVAQARKERQFLGEYFEVKELQVDAGGMLLQPVVMRHYASAPEVHLSRDTELAAREWAAHLQDKERKGAYYYAALIVPLEPVT